MSGAWRESNVSQSWAFHASSNGRCCIGRSARMTERADRDGRLIRWPTRAGRMLRGAGGGRRLR